jgi:dienelactone hydrolase
MMAAKARSFKAALSVLAVALAFPAFAEPVEFHGARGSGFPWAEQVSADLVVPQGDGRRAAVVILHGSGGIDGRGAFHAVELHRRGLATLEVLMFAPGGRPREGHHVNLTHAYGALKYLAGRGDIESAQIMVMGFSFGANLALRAASAVSHDAFADDLGGLRFAGHAAFYPSCWTHARLQTNPRHPHFGAFNRLTGAPILILAGGQDDYGPPDDCPRFTEMLRKAPGARIELEFYPDATHGWDGQTGRERFIHDAMAFEGRGGRVRLTPDPQVAAHSRDRMAAFFTGILGE